MRDHEGFGNQFRFSFLFFFRKRRMRRQEKRGKKDEREPRTEEDSGEVRNGFSNYDAVVRTPSA